MEMGSPMICMYLLGNPDHYTNQLFAPFYWQSFVCEARKPWNWKSLSSDSTKSDGTSSTNICETEYERPEYERPERVTLFKHNGQVIGLSLVQHYRYHPAELHNMFLYDWISRYQHEKQTTRKKKAIPVKDKVKADSEVDSSNGSSANHGSGTGDCVDKKSSKTTLLTFLMDCPLAETHGACKLKKIHVPNFIGQTLPQCDQGDCEYYCSTMLTLFKP
jgi:hypothetical protein